MLVNKGMGRMRVAVAWVAALGLLAGAGSVKMRDGRMMEGEVRLGDGEVVVRGADGTESRVAAEAVARLVVSERPAVERLVGDAQGRFPSGWRSGDIGRVHRVGMALCDEKGGVTVKTSGWGAWGPDDAFHFAWRELDGDGQIIARITAVDESMGQMVVGVMMRESLAIDSLMAGACRHSSGEVRLNHRPHTVDGPDFKTADEVTARPWVRLTRRGNLFTAYRSSDGRLWEYADSEQIPMKQRLLVGVAAWTITNTALGEARLDSVQVIPGTPGASYFPGGSAMMEGLVFRDGTARAGTILSAETSGVRLGRGGGVMLVPWERIARVVFNPEPPELARSGAKRGAWLVNGDVVEGEITGMAMRPVNWSHRPRLQIGLRSVLFGVRYVEAERDAISAVVADVAAERSGYEVIGADGSVYRGPAVEIQRGGVVLNAEWVGDVVEVRRLEQGPGAEGR